MKTNKFFSYGIMVVILSLLPVMVYAQNTNPTQTVCIGLQNYYVVPGDAGNIFNWTVSPGISGTDWLIQSSTSVNTNIDWLKAGTYIVTFTETNISTNCETIITLEVTVLDLPTAVISYAGSPYCASGTAAVTQSGQGGGTYTSTTGLAINSTTGAIDLSASTPGTYTVTYSFTSGTCSSTTTTSITINALPVASITYSGSPYCGSGTATVTQTGQAGGTYSSTAGLSINASTGTVNLGASTPGDYTVTYSFTNGTCSSIATTTIRVNAIPATSPIWHN